MNRWLVMLGAYWMAVGLLGWLGFLAMVGGGVIAIAQNVWLGFGCIVVGLGAMLLAGWDLRDKQEADQ